MSDHALPHSPTRARAAAARLRSEYGIVVAALGVVALHVVDDNYLQPARGTSPLDHLASGLVPLTVLAAFTAVYPRLRAGARATLAMTFGALGAATGVPAAYHLADGSASGDQYTGLLALAAGLVLLAVGPAVLWKNRHRRLGRAAGSAAIAVVATPLIAMFVVFPIALAYGYTHIGRTTASIDAVGLAHESVSITTSDGIELSAAYVPSKNGAAVVVFPGAAALKEARMIARNGYGVLLLDPRGQGRSGGDNVRWAGDRDLIAAAEYLQTRPDLDPDRIGAFGSSVGGEILLEAAAKSDAFAAVISEGAGERVGEQDTSGFDTVLVQPQMAVLTAAITVFGNHGPPPPIVERIGRIAPRPVFLIYADPGMSGEPVRQPLYYAVAGAPKRIWRAGSAHTGGIDARPAEFERRVIGFLDEALLAS